MFRLLVIRFISSGSCFSWLFCSQAAVALPLRFLLPARRERYTTTLRKTMSIGYTKNIFIFINHSYRVIYKPPARLTGFISYNTNLNDSFFYI
jgi:hypothetical protein